MREISITRALQTLKLLDDKINKAMRETTFVETRKNSADKVQNGTLTVEEYEKQVKAAFESVNDLISQRKELKSAIVKSNAGNNIEIAGNTYTVADAIERKTSISYEKNFLEVLKKSLNRATSSLESANIQLDMANEKLVESLISSDKNNKDLVKTSEDMAKARWEANKTVFVDPLKLTEVISKMGTEIIEFENEVDMCLSEANSKNTIVVEN